MPFPVTGEAADITVNTPGNELHYLLMTALRDTRATINWEGGGIDTTGFSGSGVSMRTQLSGLRSGTINVTGIYPRSAPRLGNSGGVTFASGYTQFAREWTMNIEYGETEITSPGGNAVTWRRFMPGGVGTWGGTYAALAVNDPVYTLPTVPNNEGASATFKLTEDGTNDSQLSGNIIVTGVSHPLEDLALRQELTYTYAGSGPLTQTKGDTLPGLLYATTGPVVRPSWDTSGSDGVPDIEVEVKYASGRMFTGPAFWRSLSITCPPDGVITVAATLRMADAFVGT